MFYDGPTNNGYNYLYPEPGPHAYYNPTFGSILTKAATWPQSVAQALGFDSVPTLQLQDPSWWSDMSWYMNTTLNATYAPSNKTIPFRRYWEWNASYPSTYPKYYVTWPPSTWNGAAWPAHLYGSLPASWGAISNVTRQANLKNLRIMQVLALQCC